MVLILMISLTRYFERAFVLVMIQYVYKTDIDCDMVDLLFYGHLTLCTLLSH